jgi:hypothetical protein
MKIITSTINIFKEQKKTSIHENSFKEKRKTTLRIKENNFREETKFLKTSIEDISKEDNYESITMVLTTQTVVNDRNVVKLSLSNYNTKLEKERL